MNNLAEKMRPKTLNQVIGQDHLLEEDELLSMMVYSGKYQSMVFFGPPGSGKTTLSEIMVKEIADTYKTDNVHYLNASSVKVPELRKILESKSPIILMDEIHRMNKDKQDILLEPLEDGSAIVVGTTTENPNFALNPAIRSRVALMELNPLGDDDIKEGLMNAVIKEYSDYSVGDSEIESIAEMSSGDMRFALMALERMMLLASKTKETNMDIFRKMALSPNTTIDKNASGYHEMLSALQKSIRGYHTDAALYYLAELLKVNDLVSLERRLISIAYEDIGLANPELCSRVVIACDAAKKIGMPEARLPLSNVVIEMCNSPHSRSAYKAINSSMELLDKSFHQAPDYLKLNVFGRAREDEYDYNDPQLWNNLNYLPEAIKEKKFYKSDNVDIIYDRNKITSAHPRTHDIRKAKNKG